jgi:CubicO group peptidase (beta-lactamase class C family)
MKAKIICILVVTLMIGIMIFPVTGHITISSKIDKNCNETVTKKIITDKSDYPMSNGIDGYIENQMSTYNIPGLSATIVKNNNVFWTKSYGYANISNDQLMENTTFFYLASVTKTITATAIMQLYENGDISDLNDSINDYLPFEVNHPYHSTDITFFMLLTHTSSIQDNPLYINYTDGDPTIPLGEFLEEYFTPGGDYYSPDNFYSNEPGTFWGYTNAGVGLIGYLVEVINNSDDLFYEYCETNIFEPLDMAETHWFLKFLNISNIAVPYLWDEFEEEYIPYDHYGRVVYPGSGLRSSVTLLRHFLMMYINGGVFNTTQVLEESTINLMLSVHWSNFMGLIWWKSSAGGRTTWYHMGSTQGCRTVLAFEPATDIGVIVLTNSAHDQIDDISLKLFDFAENEPPYEPSNPEPEDGETDVDIDIELSWTGGDPNDYVKYDVYFGTSSPPPKVESNQSDTTYDPGLLEFDTTYYWKIIAWDEFDCSTEGPIWSFTTEENLPPNEPSDPDPADEETNVDVDHLLYWTGGDPNIGDTVTYDVYFGISSPPPLVIEGISETSYDPGTMELSTTYYWQIVSEDSQGLTTTGPIWKFTTQAEPNDPPGAPDIDGPIKGDPGTSYDYKFNSVDPDDDIVKYYIDWGDGNTDETGFNPSGTDVTVSHTWAASGKYTITTYAEDEPGNKGPTSTLQVTMPRNKAVTNNMLLLRILERCPVLERLYYFFRM